MDPIAFQTAQICHSVIHIPQDRHLGHERIILIKVSSRLWQRLVFHTPPAERERRGRIRAVIMRGDRRAYSFFGTLSNPTI